MSAFEISVDEPDAPEVLTSSVDDDQDDHAERPSFGADIASEVVTEAKVRRLLKAVGGGLHQGAEHFVPEAAVVPDFLAFTEAELDALAPPLTAYIAARPRLTELAERGDTLAVVLALVGWGTRNAGAWMAIQTLRQEDTDGHLEPEAPRREDAAAPHDPRDDPR